jgi:NarL family two-component system response regulator LiaR
MKKIRILLAEDHALVREGTRRVLEQQADMEIVGEAGDGEAALKLALETKPDIALIDIVMPKLNGIDVTKQIKALCPQVAVLILSAYDEDQFVFSLLKAGASGYLLKSIHEQELIDAIRTVYKGEPVLHPNITRKIMGRFSSGAGAAAPKTGREVLNERETEILRLATRGLSNGDIARELGVSLRSVQRHFNQILQKLNVNSRTDVIIRGLREGWFSLNDKPLETDR